MLSVATFFHLALGCLLGFIVASTLKQDTEEAGCFFMFVGMCIMLFVSVTMHRQVTTDPELVEVKQEFLATIDGGPGPNGPGPWVHPNLRWGGKLDRIINKRDAVLKKHPFVTANWSADGWLSTRVWLARPW